MITEPTALMSIKKILNKKIRMSPNIIETNSKGTAEVTVFISTRPGLKEFNLEIACLAIFHRS